MVHKIQLVYYSVRNKRNNSSSTLNEYSYRIICSKCSQEGGWLESSALIRVRMAQQKATFSPSRSLLHSSVSLPIDRQNCSYSLTVATTVQRTLSSGERAERLDPLESTRNSYAKLFLRVQARSTAQACSLSLDYE